MTTYFIINGFNLNLTAAHADFSSLHEGLISVESTVVPVDISWRRKTHTKFVERFLDEYSKHKSDKNIVIGNSFGALVALLSAGQFKPDELHLCSLSPFIKESLEDNKVRDYVIKRFGIRRAEDLKQYSIGGLANQVNALGMKVNFLYGEQEKKDLPFLVEFAKKYSKLFNNSRVSEIKGAPHSMRDPAYQKGLMEILK